MNYRLAEEQDFPGLAEMHWDFRTEYKPPVGALPKVEFISAFVNFFASGTDQREMTLLDG